MGTRQWRHQWSLTVRYLMVLSPSGAVSLQSSSEKAMGLGHLLWSEKGVYRTRDALSTNKKSVSAKPKDFYSQILISRETRGSGANYWLNLVSKNTYMYMYIDNIN